MITYCADCHKRWHELKHAIDKYSSDIKSLELFEDIISIFDEIHYFTPPEMRNILEIIRSVKIFRPNVRDLENE